jgi:Holliday junction resolvase-like predicted endonuclease
MLLFTVSCIGQDPCENVTCDTVCRGDDLWEQECRNGDCVDSQIVEKNSIECGCDPLKKEEYAVYDALLEAGRHIIEENFPNLGEIQVIVIEDHTCWCLRMRYLYGAVGTCDSVTEEIPALKQETFDDFENKNADLYPLDDSFSLEVPVVLLSEDEIHDLMEPKSASWGDKLYEKHNSKGILTLSRVGFNPDMNQALVYIGIYSIYNSGMGYYVLLVKESDNWKIQDIIEAWIS